MGDSYAIGDLVDSITSPLSAFDTANYTLPDDIRANNSAYVFQEGRAPALLDSLVGDDSVDGHDYRSDLNWIVEESGFSWVIADAADVLAELLEKDGKRNVEYLLADGESAKDGGSNGWYRRHVRDFPGRE